MKHYYVYILANKKYGTLYTGITNDLIRRIKEHKESKIKGFTKKYDVNKLVYFEEHKNMDEAILRVKRVKKWNRKWKLKLIEDFNKDWKDLYNDLF
ncbi:GIY-YIG nuclease family protein [candidate division KSB1 bacterium]